MKRVMLSGIFIICMILAVTAQDNSVAYRKGNSTISAGYGFFNIWKTFLTDIAGEKNVTATGPFAITYDYGLNKWISIGFSGGYSEVNNKITYSSNTGNSYTVKEKLTNFSAVLLGNFHFGKYFKKVDPYIGGGIGYYYFKYESSESIRKVAPTQFGISGQLGCKYYFTPRWGAYLEAGYVAGSIIQVGVTAKF